MNKLSERVLLGGIAGGLVLALAAGCSSSSTPATSSGAGAPTTLGTAGASGTGVVATPGAAGFSTASGGASGTGVGGGGVVVSGGAGRVAGAGGVATGTGGATAGAAGVAGTAGAAAVCNSSDPNLVNATGCYVGCDPTLSTDNPQGIQGAFYGFGDGTTCPMMPPPPCGTGGVCMTGATVAVAADYGCGIGLGLNADSTGAKQFYTGTASCFNYTLTGNSGGNEVRVGFTQVAAPTTASPFVSIPAFTNGATGTVCFKDASCNGITPCTAPSATAPSAYDIQFEVIGGVKAGAFNVCLSSLTPATSGGTTFSQLCGAQGATNATANVGKYFAQNNVNPGDGSLCLTPALTGTTPSFAVNSASFTNGNNVLAAYPSIVDGWHYGRVSTDTALPKLMSAVTTVNSTVAYTGSNGKYDASYDMWILPTATATTPANGLEVMLWLNDSGVNPAGSQPMVNGQPLTFMGYEEWVGTVQNWKYIAFRKTGQSGFSGDLAPFLREAVTRSGLGGTPYLAGIEFGFELYDASGAAGFKVTSFTSDVK